MHAEPYLNAILFSFSPSKPFPRGNFLLVAAARDFAQQLVKLPMENINISLFNKWEKRGSEIN